MPFTKVWLHFVWSTKNRERLLTSSELRLQVFDHIRDNATTKGIYLDLVNGYFDHAHCLLSLGIDQTICKVVQLIKGESSFWINKNRLCVGRFQWQEEYFVESVSPGQLTGVREYIKNQEEHHSRKTFQEEYDEMICHWSQKSG